MSMLRLCLVAFASIYMTLHAIAAQSAPPPDIGFRGILWPLDP